MEPFDNRSITRAVFLTYYLKRSVHFEIPIQNGTALYSYIRKNGSSAINRYVRSKIDLSNSKKLNTYYMLNENYRIQSVSRLLKVQKKFFICRDPIERAVSLFKNKFIAQHGNDGIKKNYEDVTGSLMEDCTFRFFVEQYLAYDWSKIDPHVRPQSHHLLPIHYDLAIPLAKLQTGMETLLGKRLAETYFSAKVNSTSLSGENYSDNLSDVRCIELQKIFGVEKTMMPTECFVTDDIKMKLVSIYKKDFEIFNAVNK